MEVSFDADVATEHGIRAAVVLNHIAHLMRFPDGSQAGHFNTCGRAYVHVSPEYLCMSLRQATEALRELREGGLIAEREYGGLDPDYRNWYTLTETGNAVA